MSDDREVHSPASQVEALGLMAAHEAAIAELYQAYAEALPSHADLFTELAEEERKHARMIAEFSDRVREGVVQVKADRFTVGQVLDSLDSLREHTARAREGGITADEALAVAAEVEDSIIERGYLIAADDDQPELRRLLRSLSADTSEHRRRLRGVREG